MRKSPLCITAHRTFRERLVGLEGKNPKIITSAGGSVREDEIEIIDKKGLPARSSKGKRAEFNNRKQALSAARALQ